MRRLLCDAGYELWLSPAGFELFASRSLLSNQADSATETAEKQSLLGAFQVTAEGPGGRALLVTSEAALYTLVDGPDGSIELRFPAADGSGLLWIVHARLDHRGLLLWQSLRNQSGEPIRLSAFRLTALGLQTSFVAGLGEQPGFQVFRTGYSSFTPSFSVDSRFREEKPLFPTAASFNLLTESDYYGKPGCLSSPWMMVLTPPAQPLGHLLVGFVSALCGTGEVAICRDGAPRIEARLGFEGRQVAVGETLTGDKLLIALSHSEQGILDEYVDETARQMQPRPSPSPVPSGWCSWYYYYTKVSERDVLRNLTALAEKKLPVKYVQLDDGYQRKVGDWLTTNAKFPSGLGGLARQIKEAGFVPGIWLAPFFVQRSSEIYQHHRDWLLRDEDGKLVRLGYHPFWGIPDGQVYSLDLTHPAVLAWLRRVFSTLCELGFEYFKIDFLFAGLRRGLRHNPQLSAVEAYRQGLRVIRETIGDRFLLGCGAPLVPSIGFVDAMRISPDVKEDWRDDLVDLIAHGTGYPSAEMALHNCLTRAHLHGKWWCNDPDCLLVRRDKSSLSLPEVQTLLSVMSLTGGMLLCSDDLRVLPGERVQLLSRTLPPSGRTARALGVLREEKPQRFVFVGDEPSGDRAALAALINWHDSGREVVLSAQAIGLPEADYVAFELWSRTMAQLDPLQTLTLRLAPHGTALWLLRRRKPHPQVVSVTHHVWQTLQLLQSETWDADGNRLTVTIAGCTRGDGEIRISVPDGLRLQKVERLSGPIELRGDALVSAGIALACELDGSNRPSAIAVYFEPRGCIQDTR
ncbi:MAG TPA: alpha-galactosidase [Pseudomonadota bacterium]|nr:alpha-galactosidase [Pseudomonadota bacterium]